MGPWSFARFAALCTALGALSACGGSSQSDAKAQEALAAVAQLRTAQEGMQRSISELEKELRKLQIDVLILKLSDNETAWFDPQDQQAYTGIKTAVGQVLFVLERVEPYLDGFKITFRVGNPTSATLNGFNAKITWGPKLDASASNQPSPREVEVKFTESIRSGAWAYVSANVAPAKPEEVRRIGITPKFNNVGLMQR